VSTGSEELREPVLDRIRQFADSREEVAFVPTDPVMRERRGLYTVLPQDGHVDATGHRLYAGQLAAHRQGLGIEQYR